MIFRLTRSVKDGVIDYLRRIFMLHQQGKLPYTNGVYRIEFSKNPIVQTDDAWEKPGGTIILPGGREYPAVLIGDASGPFSFGGMSGSHNRRGGFIDIIETDDQGNIVVGGEADLSLSMTCVARYKPERDNLVDVVCAYLMHPWFLDFLFEAVKGKGPLFSVKSAPQINGSSSVEDVSTDFKMYQTEISMEFHGFWRDVLDPLEKLRDIMLSLIVDP